eukprot:GHVO01017887.1.p1 GENE.GHVO01017887.1~~GHVO01017887.1.p1  ORF type:complete len:321 (-),score=25.49 GHVO01017887.1:167-1057(-)
MMEDKDNKVFRQMISEFFSGVKATFKEQRLCEKLEAELILNIDSFKNITLSQWQEMGLPGALFVHLNAKIAQKMEPPTIDDQIENGDQNHKPEERPEARTRNTPEVPLTPSRESPAKLTAGTLARTETNDMIYIPPASHPYANNMVHIPAPPPSHPYANNSARSPASPHPYANNSARAPTSPHPYSARAPTSPRPYANNSVRTPEGSPTGTLQYPIRPTTLSAEISRRALERYDRAERYARGRGFVRGGGAARRPRGYQRREMVEPCCFQCGGELPPDSACTVCQAPDFVPTITYL